MRGGLGVFGGVFRVLVPDNMSPVVAKADAVDPRLTRSGWSTPRRGVSSPTLPGSGIPATSPGSRPA